MRSERFKLVARPLAQGGYGLTLYDLQTGAVTDESTHPEAFAQLSHALERFSSELDDDIPDRDEETLEALRALGYIDGL